MLPTSSRLDLYIYIRERSSKEVPIHYYVPVVRNLSRVVFLISRTNDNSVLNSSIRGGRRDRCSVAVYWLTKIYGIEIVKMAEKSERTDGRDGDLKRPAQGMFATPKLVTGQWSLLNVGKFSSFDWHWQLLKLKYCEHDPKSLWYQWLCLAKRRFTLIYTLIIVRYYLRS